MNFRTMQAANRRKTIGLLMGMGVLMWCVVYAALSVWGSYYGSDKLVLTMTGAKLIQESDNPKLFDLIQEVTIASGLPMPKVAVVIDSAPNAFATGRNPEHALIAFTTGILDAMDRDQLQGVIAHEMAHVANRDTLVSAVAATTAGAIAIVSDMLTRMMFFGGGRDRNREGGGNPLALVISLVILILAPLAAVMLKSAISRKRESLAIQLLCDSDQQRLLTFGLNHHLIQNLFLKCFLRTHPLQNELPFLNLWSPWVKL